MDPQISLVMPCFNRAYDLKRALEAYDCQTGNPSFEIIAVDDGSSDDTYQLLSAYQPQNYRLKVIRLDHNQGPAAARNAGIAEARAPLLLFVGDDILPDAYMVTGHLAAHRLYSSNEAAILGKVVWASDLPINTLMTHIDGIGAQQFSYAYLQENHEYDFRHFYTANISIKRALLSTQTKWFDTSFPFAAFEDAELSYRLSQAGMRIIYTPHLVGAHYHYHTIWTFSQRQYKAGRMACIVVRNHPDSKDLIFGEHWSLKLLRLRFQSQVQKLPADTADRLEKNLLHLASAYEWTAHPNLDQLYLRLLAYFFYKGAIFETFEDQQTAHAVNNASAMRILQPLTTQFS